MKLSSFFELVEAINPDKKPQIELLSKEGNELLSIIVASINTLRKQLAAKKS